MNKGGWFLEGRSAHQAERQGWSIQSFVDPDVIARAKLRVDSRHKYLKAYKPERWGEQSTLNVKQDDSSDATICL
jgi:hypothetical protein